MSKKNLSEPMARRSQRQWQVCDIYSNKSRSFRPLSFSSCHPERLEGAKDPARNDKKGNFIKGCLTVLISSLVIFTVVQAGSLTPSASPASTMHPLSDIAGSGFATATHSLKSLYDKINGLVADIWDKQTSELTTSGSAGKLLVDNLDVAISSRAPSSTALSDSVWTDDKAGYLDATISSRSTLTQSDILSDATPFQGADIASTLSNSSGTVSSLTGTYDASEVSSNVSGNVMEQLKYIRENFSGAGTCATPGYSCLHYGNNDPSYVLTSVGGSYLATYLISSNIKSGVNFGDGQQGTFVCNEGTIWQYGSDDPAKVLTIADANAGNASFNAESLTVGVVKKDVQFGVGPLTGSLVPSGGTAATTDVCLNETYFGDSQTDWTSATGVLTIDASKVAPTASYCGVSGTLLKNLYNGSAASGHYPQNVGGVDDYNDGGDRPSDSYAKSWTTCNEGNSYCDTNDATNADKKDDSTGLVWSKWLDSGNTHTWFWANNCYEPDTVENPGTCVVNGDDACQCVKKTSSKVGCEALGDGNWRLPYQKELMQAYINGSWGNLSSAANYFWSATTMSDGTHGAWSTYLNYGYTYNYTKVTGYPVRCVR